MKKRKIVPDIYLIISIVLMFLFYFIFPQLNVIPTPYNWLGIIGIVAGVIILFLAKNAFRVNETTDHVNRLPTAFASNGIYRITRNPMYLAGISMLMGAAICFGNILGLIPVAIFFLGMQFSIIPYEERKMQSLFGDDYIKYRQAVRRWI